MVIAIRDTSTARCKQGKLLHLIASVDPAHGGPVEALSQLYSVFKRSGIEIEVATLDQADAPFLKDYPFKVHALGRPKVSERWAKTKIPWVRYRYSRKYPKWLNRNLDRFDAVFVHGLWTHISLGALGPLTRSQKPYFLFTHGALDPWFRRAYPFKHWIKQLFWWAGEGRLLRGAKNVLFTTEEERNLSRGAFIGYAVRERVIRYGIADPLPYTEEQERAFELSVPGLSGRRFLLYLSRIHPKKAVDQLIRAFAVIADQDPDLQLVIAGPDETGWRNALLKIADSEGVADRIHWPGMLRGDAKWGAFRTCEAFALLSHQENFGVVVAEALSCAKPVLISDKVNIWREILSCQAGIVGPDTLEGAKDVLRQWVERSPEQKLAAGTAARDCFLAYFDINKTSADILALVQSVIANGDS